MLQAVAVIETFFFKQKPRAAIQKGLNCGILVPTDGVYAGCPTS
jgi:hypothetical protein